MISCWTSHNAEIQIELQYGTFRLLYLRCIAMVGSHPQTGHSAGNMHVSHAIITFTFCLGTGGSAWFVLFVLPCINTSFIHSWLWHAAFYINTHAHCLVLVLRGVLYASCLPLNHTLITVQLVLPPLTAHIVPWLYCPDMFLSSCIRQL